MWVRQLGQNQSICLNLTQQNGDKDFSAKHDKSVIEGKEKWNVCSPRFYFLDQDCIEGWTKNPTIKWLETDAMWAMPGRSFLLRWNISITEWILENQIARFKLLENVRADSVSRLGIFSILHFVLSHSEIFNSCIKLRSQVTVRFNVDDKNNVIILWWKNLIRWILFHNIHSEKTELLSCNMEEDHI